MKYTSITAVILVQSQLLALSTASIRFIDSHVRPQGGSREADPLARGPMKGIIGNESIAAEVSRGTSSDGDVETTSFGMLNRWLEGINPWTDAPDCCLGFDNRDCTENCIVGSLCNLQCGHLLLPENPIPDVLLQTQIKAENNARVTLTVLVTDLRPGDNIIVYHGDSVEPVKSITCDSFSKEQQTIYLISAGDTFIITYKYTESLPKGQGCGGLEDPTGSLTFSTLKKVECNSPLAEDTNGDLYGDIVSPGYPFSPYPSLRDCTWTIQAPSPGYGIELQVQEFDLDAAYGDYIRINAGSPTSKSQGYVLTWSDTKSHSFKIIFGGSATVSFHSGLHTTPNARKGFHIVYKHYGNGSLPASTTTSGPDLPTPSPGYNTNYTIYIAGKTPEELDYGKNSFKDSLMTIANHFCQVEHIDLEDPIVFQDVIIHSISHCPPTWPHSQTCAEVTIQIVAHTVSGAYELTDSHLQQMWDRFGWDRNVTRSGIMPYERNPDVVTWWLVGALVVLVLFILILMAAWYFQRSPHHPSPREKQKTKTPTEENIPETTKPENLDPPFRIINEDDDDEDGTSYTSDYWDSYNDYEGSSSYSNYNDSSISVGKINPVFHDEDDEDHDEIDLGADDFKFKFTTNGFNRRSGNNYLASSTKKVLSEQRDFDGEKDETAI